MTPWEIQAREMVNCNCSYGCPCQFNALPTQGYCEAIGGFLIDRGHYGATSLDGVKAAIAFSWPGPIHQGKGKGQVFVDVGATEAQREAVLKIFSGQDSDPFATVFAVFATTMEKVYDPIFAPIEIEIDVDARRGTVRVGSVLQVEGQPIRNPVTGAEHRVRIDLPHGFEYELAEIGSGTSYSRGDVAIDLQDSYAQFARLHLNNHGVVRHRAVA
ncbi:MAG TPA: DUF1326 domain-containing protein [Steroidobacteraceae bacterium]|nr:DUF1326 domain-containing protein [Steroidobacteraceae bacterium]